jgi:TonB family protein
MSRSSAAAIIWMAVSISTTVVAQNQAALEAPQAAARLKELSPPIYPRLAQQARISGEVLIRLDLGRDGGVESAEAVNGHPILRQAALDSAQKSVFECGGCRQTTLLYMFELRDGCHFGRRCEPLDPDQSLIVQSPGRVVISATALCICDPASVRIKIRSAKCIYLWKCGHRDLPDD